MSAALALGPWGPCSLLRKPGERRARLIVRRPVLSDGQYRSEHLRDADGVLCVFDTLADAQAAAAKAQGAQS